MSLRSISIVIITILVTNTISKYVKSYYQEYNFVHGENFLPPKNLRVAESIDPFIDDFIKDALAHNVDYTRLYSLDSIMYKISTDYAGATYIDFHGDTIQGNIFINPVTYYVYHDTIGMRLIVYHEIGHWYGLDHEENSIMKLSYNTYADQLWADANWEDLLDDYFNKIKALDPKYAIQDKN